MAMKMGDLGFPEEDGYHVPARIEHRNSLRPFIPVIVSTGGGGTTLPLLQEKHFDQTLNFSCIAGADDGVDTTVGMSDSVDPRVHNPMPLRWFIPKGGEGSSSGLERAPRKKKRYDVAGERRKRCNGDDDDLDSTLGQSNSVDPRVYNPMPLRWFIPKGGEGSSSGLERAPRKKKQYDVAGERRKRCNGDDDDLDSTLGQSNSVDPRVYDPMPLRWCMPEGDESLSSGLEKVEKRRKLSSGDDGEAFVAPSIEEFPLVLKAIEEAECNGSRPVFLYRKKLEGSDVRGDQSRLFLTKREKLFEFLNPEEVAAVDETTEGVKNIMGVDQQGKTYDKLWLKLWPSLNMTVMNGGDWNKLVSANNAEKGDFVLIWGFRHNDGKLGFAIIFTK